MSDNIIIMHYIKFILVFIIPVIFFMSCRDNENKKLKSTGNQIDESIISLVDKSESDETTKVLTIYGNAVLFFKLNNKEYNTFIKQSGKYSKYDFDLIFKNFSRLASATKRVSLSQNFKVYNSSAEKFIFIDNKKDTFYFDRRKDELILGTAFFSGDSQPYIEQGLMKKKELKSKITEYFKITNLEDIFIKEPVVKNAKLLIDDSTSVISDDTIQ